MSLTGSAVTWPPALPRAARVALVSPSGPVRSADDLKKAEQNVRDLGLHPVLAANAGKKQGYFAGTDQDRLQDLNSAMSDDTIDALWCVRGGYGAIRVLRDLDYASLARKPKTVIGYSDITALHAALAVNCEIVTFHGPTARGHMSAFSRESFTRAVIYQEDSCGRWDSARTLRPGSAHGKLAGGNLSLVASLIGTKYQIDLRDSILVLEDINEAVYRVDRLMQQLLLSGSLDNCAAITAGDFTLPSDDTDSVDRPVDEVFSEIAAQLGIPCLSGIPVGHIEDQWTVPLGALAMLDTETKSLTIVTPNSKSQ